MEIRGNRSDTAEVRCATHGVFTYHKAECPGCDPERRTYRQRQEDEREALRALRQDDNVRGMLFVLERKHGIEHVLGSLGQTYHGVLLGAVDIGGKRYARLHRRPLGEVVCLPWVDAFAEWLGEKIAVEWCENEANADHFKVRERDGVIEAPKPPKPTLRELQVTDAGEDDALVQEYCFPNQIAAKLAVADVLGRPLAQLAPEEKAFLQELLGETMVRRIILERVHDRFLRKPFEAKRARLSEEGVGAL